ncbi:MAG: metalloregulator ArsR/SmtB family transcription factor [Armatimonadota bacterium]
MSIFDEISEQSRRAILMNLMDGSRSVNELVESTGLRQPNVSNHLARLRAKGIVSANRIGRHIYYSIARAEVEDALNAIIRTTTDGNDGASILDLVVPFARAACRGDERECNRIVDQALRTSRDLITLYTQLLGASMTTIGAWYMSGAIDEAQEHMTSSITERQMTRIMNYLGSPAPGAKVAVIGAAPQNHHTIGLRMLSDYLTSQNWSVRFLGANVPIPSFIREVSDSRPDLVLVSCSHDEGAEWTLRMIRELVSLRSGAEVPKIGVGGGIVNRDPKRFLEEGADFLATSLEQFADAVLQKVLDPA